VFTIKNQLPAGVTLNDRNLEELILQDPTESPRARNRPHFTSSSKSTSLGMHHIALACKGARGSFSIQAADGTRGDNTAALNIIVLPAFIGSLSQNKQIDQAPAVQKADADGSKEQLFPGGLKICAIDDSSLICKGYKRLCLPALKADMTKSRIVCPRSKADVNDFLSYVFMEKTSSDQERGSADIILLDQNIELRGEETVYGTALTSKLRGLGFQGLIAIRSANSNPSDVTEYLKSGADLCIGKDQTNKAFASIISSAYLKKTFGGNTNPRRYSAAPEPSESSTCQRPGPLPSGNKVPS